jgi:phosphoribosylcarboxyaminoimidazole (NCAIR) mutase
LLNLQKTKQMKKIAVIVGSQSDLTQCIEGFEFLESQRKQVLVVGVYIRSQHRNMEDVKQLLRELVNIKIDAVIVGAGWANHLTGCCDAFLRFNLRSTDFPVIGVAFDDPVNEQHTQAAILSITEVPGTQVVYKDGQDLFVGHNGFLKACQFAVCGKFPIIFLPEPRATLDLSLNDALVLSSHNGA